MDVTIIQNDPDNPHGYDEQLFTDDGKKFKGLYAQRIFGEESAKKLFGDNYQDLDISPKTLESILLQIMVPPSRPMGIDFSQCQIQSDYLPGDEFNNEIISYVGSMDERFVFYCEAMDDTPIDWLSTCLNVDLVMRHIPLLYHDDGFALFHAQHLYEFLSHIFKMPFSAAIFGCTLKEYMELEL